MALTWAVLAVMSVVAKLGGEVALRLRQPAVLGELLTGVLSLLLAGASAAAGLAAIVGA
jgi:Kef-type K+ transport system membrane component KefB